jgi:UDP-glucose 4-epimerase
MISHDVNRIVFSSSATVYGTPKTVPIREDFPTSTTNPYGETKLMIERILKDTCVAHPEFSACVLRYFNPIGAHPSALIGELPRGVPNNLVPFITQTAIGKRECLSIFGNDYPTEDGTCLRDYIDIVDLAKAHVAAVTRMVEGKMKQGYEIFNVGTGRPVSVYELVTAFEKVNGLKLNYKFVDRRPGDVMAIWADTQLANEELGWKAERSVEDTLASAWAWEKYLAGK